MEILMIIVWILMATVMFVLIIDSIFRFKENRRTAKIIEKQLEEMTENIRIQREKLLLPEDETEIL